MNNINPIGSLRVYFNVFDIINNQILMVDNLSNLECGFTSIDISNNIFSPDDNNAYIKVVFKNIGVINKFTSFFAGGNIIQILENNNTPKVVFVGYIKTISINISIQNSGTAIDVACGSLLSQLYSQMMVDYNEQASYLQFATGIIANSYVRNQVPLSNILLYMTSNSLLSFATNVKNSIVGEYSIVKGTRIPFVVTQGIDGFNINTPVYFYSPPEQNKLSALLNTIYAYQKIIYQDLNGAIRITNPSASDNNKSNIYFDNTSFSNDPTNPKFISMSITLNDGTTPNRVYSSLISTGFQTVGQNEKSFVNYVTTPNASLFSRLAKLLKTGLFTISRSYNPEISSNEFVTNPFLIRLLDIASNSNKHINIKNSSIDKENQTIVGGYAGRALAEYMTSETNININASRVALKEIPFGKLVNVSSPWLPDTSSYYCYGFNLSYQAEDATASLALCKPFTNTLGWEKNV